MGWTREAQSSGPAERASIALARAERGCARKLHGRDSAAQHRRLTGTLEAPEEDALVLGSVPGGSKAEG
eukprot:scaffold46220_cov53-Phaeocystis_antarctica.AAC.3